MKRIAASSTLLLALISTTTAVAGPGDSEAALPGGTPISVTIDLPVEGTEFVIPSGETAASVDVAGTATVGMGAPSVSVVYVMDVSLSTIGPAGGSCGGDRNGDGMPDTVLDCQVAAVLALNEAAIAQGTVGEVGFVVYGQGGAAADLSPGPGDDPLTAPDAGPNDVATVVSSVVSPFCDAGVRMFTEKIVGCGPTNYAAGLAATTPVVSATTLPNRLVVFLSDGLSNAGGGQFDANLAALVATDATVHTFAIGSTSTCTGGTDGTLAQIAGATGGTCTEVSDPALLPDIVPGVFSSSLDFVTLSVDAGPAVALPGDASVPPLPQPGPAAAAYASVADGLAPGSHTLCATAHGTDAAGVGDSGEACVTVFVFRLTLEPPHGINELRPGATHTVTATVLGEGVEGRQISFSVIDGPNAGATGVCPDGACLTGAGSGVSWTYEARRGRPGLGTDTIQACLTVGNPTGATACETVTKEWVDTTPPEAACETAANPHGETIPPAGSSDSPGRRGGQNEDGFYSLAATDSVDPSPEVWARDGGSGVMFGPFPAGTVVKYTQAPGARPAQKPMGSDRGRAGHVDWHLTGQGDLEILAIDLAGNESRPQTCYVPPRPK